MKILIKTPLYKSSKYVPHLIEHSIFHNTDKSFESYLKLQYPISAVTETGYTEFTIPNTFDTKSFLQNNILEDLIPQTIKQEKQIIKDENTDMSYRQELLIKIGQILYNKNFSLTRGYQISFQYISQYHKNYYKNGNIIICDDNYNKIHREQINTTTKQQQDKKETEKTFKTSLNYEKYNIYSIVFGSRKDFYLMKFIETLIGIYLARDNTVNKNNYFYDDEGFFIIDEYLALSLPTNTNISITENMISTTKQYFTNAIQNKKFLFGKILNKLYFGDNIQNKDISEYINNISISQIQKILSLLDKK